MHKSKGNHNRTIIGVPLKSRRTSYLLKQTSLNFGTVPKCQRQRQNSSQRTTQIEMRTIQQTIVKIEVKCLCKRKLAFSLE